MFESISSVHNPRIKNLVRLRDGHHRRRQNRFLIEGFREIQRALLGQWPLESLFFCEDLFKEPEAYELLESIDSQACEILRLSPEAFRKCAYRQGPDGLLATAPQRLTPLEQLPLSATPLLVILEAVEKPGNIGAVFRTANAAGADALILANPVTDPFNPNVIRASQGAFFQLPFAQATNAELLPFLLSHGIHPVPTSPYGDSFLWEAPLTTATALLLGTEKTGLSSDWLDGRRGYRLPMKGSTDSLNLASTAAIALFEAVRQRGL